MSTSHEAWSPGAKKKNLLNLIYIHLPTKAVNKKKKKIPIPPVFTQYKQTANCYHGIGRPEKRMNSPIAKVGPTNRNSPFTSPTQAQVFTR